MIKKNVVILLFINLYIAFGFAQSTEQDLTNVADSINVIIKENPLAYYINDKKHGEFIRKINVTERGLVSFTDSIPSSQITTQKPKLLSDCCPPKNSRKLDLFAIKSWEIHYPYANLKDADNKIYAKFLGFKKEDLEKLKELFEKLKTLCKKY